MAMEEGTGQKRGSVRITRKWLYGIAVGIVLALLVGVYAERIVRRIAGRGAIGQDKTAIGDGW